MATETPQQLPRTSKVCSSGIRQPIGNARNPHRKFNFAAKAASGSAFVPLGAEQAASSRPIYAFRAQESAAANLTATGADVPSVLTSESHSLFGWPAGLVGRFEVEEAVLGRGGNAIIRKARCKQTGKEYACKSIEKVLRGPQWSDLKRAGHLDAIRQEVEALRRLRGSLSVAALEDVYEDGAAVHLVTELCRGGELVHRIGSRHYSERTVASYMRAVLRTVAQCHSHHILHRDIKPGNFLLLNDDEMAPLKAIDFGLATPFDPAAPPRSDLGLEGTPWYMAPEVLSSQVGPGSDVWSAGVMAFQLLTGRFPFDDRRNPLQPAVTRIWQSILGDKLDFGRSYWTGVSDGAKDFVASLLQRDLAARPTAKQALRHPWLAGDAAERSTGRQLPPNVVQRIQRFGQHSLLKRTVLEHIAADMLDDARAGSDAATAAAAPGMPQPMTGPLGSPLHSLYSAASFGDRQSISRQQVLSTLESLGYRLDAREGAPLLDALDAGQTGAVGRAQLAASQIDWRVLQAGDAAGWRAAAERAFAGLDADGDGVWSRDEMLRCLHARAAPGEVEVSLRQAMAEAQKKEESIHKGIDFDAFMTMLRSNSCDSLDQYDGRMGSSADRLSLLLDSSCRGSDAFRSAYAADALRRVC